MKFLLSSRLYRIPLILTLVVVGITFAYPNGVQGIVQDFNGYRQHTRIIEDAQVYDAELNERSQFLTDRIQAKQSIIEAVMQDEMQLLEASERFLALNIHDRTTMDYIRVVYEGSTDLERSAQNIIDYVEYNQPHLKSAPVIRRLEAQYRNHFGYSRQTKPANTSHPR